MKITTSPWNKFPAFDPTKDGLTQTLMGEAMACPRKLWFFLNRLHNPEREKVFEFGTLMHDLMDHLYSGRIEDDAGIYLLLDESYEGEDAQKLALASALGRGYLIRYAKELRGKDFKCEQSFNFELPKRGPVPPMVLRGKRDITFIKNKKEVWLMEHKFWSQINLDELVTTLPFNFQVNFYAWTYWKETGVMPKGIIFNVVRKPQNKLNKDTGSIKEFEERVFAAIQEKPEYYFYRVPISVTPSGLERFEEDFYGKFFQLQGMLKEYIYRNEFSCFASFPCNFHDSCFSKNLKLLTQKQTLFPELEEVNG